MHFPGSLNSHSFFKPQIMAEVFLPMKYCTIFFQNLQRDLDYKKKEMTDEK